jgi:uncharacterized caspase-like protein
VNAQEREAKMIGFLPTPGRWLAIVLLAFAVIGNTGEATAKRVALVVGNGAYVNAPTLPNPTNDAKAVAIELEKLGFEVHLALDVTQSAGLDALDTFAAALPGAEAAVFFYSGHGMQLDGSNFLLPVDVEATSERSVRYGSIDIAEVVRDMEQNAEVAIVVLDACRDNPFAAQLQSASPRSRSTGATRGLAVIKPSGNGTIIAYAAAAGAVASDGESEHSPYTAALLKYMNAPNVEVGLMFRRVAGDVVTATSGEQQPEVLIRLTREFYMNAESVAPEIAAPPAQPTEIAASDIETPPAPTAGQSYAAAEIPARTSAAPEPEAAAYPPEERGAYADLLTRIDLDPAFYQPPLPWTPPPKVDVVEYEPNNSFGSANPIGANAALSFGLDPVGDADFLYFKAEAGGTMSFQSSGQPPEIDLAIRVLNADGVVVRDWFVAPRPGGVLEGWFDVPAPGAYWLEIRDNYNDAASPAVAYLDLAFTPQDDLYEPNDQPSTARILATEGRLRLNILPLGDADHFLFPIKSPGEFSVRATEVPEELDVAMRLLDYDLNPLSNWVVAPRPGGETDARFAIAQPGIYLVEVRDNYNDARSSKGFTLDTHFEPSQDPYEPNESVAAARWLPPTGEHLLNIFPVNDADWFKIEVDHPGELWIETAEVPENLDVVFRVLNADMRDLTGWIAPPRPGGIAAGSADLSQTGTYFIEVRDSYNDQASVRPFTIVTRFTPSPDQYEPNDSPKLATPLRPTGEIAFNILPLGEGDWFTIRVDQPGELAVTIDEGPENLDLVYRVLNSDRVDLTGWVQPYSKGGLTEGLADLPRPGVYFIEVRDNANDGRSIQPAVLATHFTPADAADEPNESFGTATEVPVSGTTSGYILPRGDADWRVFYVPEPGRLDVAVEGVAEKLDVVLRVLDGDQRDLTGWIVPPRPGGVTSGQVAIEKPGWYWMEIRDGANDERSTQPFQITQQFAPAQ